VSQFLIEAKTFVVSSHDAIERSAPHIYVSALPFADKNSLVFKEFAPRLTGLIQVEFFGISHHAGSAVMILTSHGGPVRSVSYSEDGQLLASGSDDGTVRLWNMRTGEASQSPLRSGDGRVLSVDFALNNLWVASGTESGTVCVWDVGPTRASHRRLSGHSGQVNSVAFSRDSSRLTSASGDKTVCIWNSETSERLVVLVDPNGAVHKVAFSPDGTTVGTSCRGWHIRLCDIHTGELVRTSQDLNASDNADFSPDGEMLAGSYEQTVLLGDYKTGMQTAALECGININSVQFSPDG